MTGVGTSPRSNSTPDGSSNRRWRLVPSNFYLTFIGATLFLSIIATTVLEFSTLHHEFSSPVAIWRNLAGFSTSFSSASIISQTLSGVIDDNAQDDDDDEDEDESDIDYDYENDGFVVGLDVLPKSVIRPQSRHVKIYHNISQAQRKRQKGPIQMKVHYYERWDHLTNTIQIPPEHRYFGVNKRLSLEILQDIIRNQRDQPEHSHLTGGKGHFPSCFLPNTTSAKVLAEDIKKGKVHLSNDPILYVGFPKTGTTTLWHFFECAGFMASHQQQCPMIVEDHLKGMGRGDKLLETKWTRMKRKSIDMQAKVEGKSKKQRATLRKLLKVAHLQMDSNVHGGCYPQIQLLDEIHQDYPDATFIMAFRPIDDWIRSVISHHGMSTRWSMFEMPGLIFTEKQLELRSEENLTKQERRPILSAQQIRRWWCGHVQHIREYVQEYPSHHLIELDLYDDEETSTLLADIFQTKRSCWGHKNKNEDLATAIQNGTVSKRLRMHKVRKQYPIL